MVDIEPKQEGGPAFLKGSTGPRVFLYYQHSEAAEAVGGNLFNTSTAAPWRRPAIDMPTAQRR